MLPRLSRQRRRRRRIALTWRVRRAAATGDVAAALRDASELASRFGGGMTPEGTALPPPLLEAGIVAAVLDGAAAAIAQDDLWLARIDDAAENA